MAWPAARAASAASRSARWTARTLAPPSTTSPARASSPTMAIATNRVTAPRSDGCTGRQAALLTAGRTPGDHDRPRNRSIGLVISARTVRWPGMPGTAMSASGTAQRTLTVTLAGDPTATAEATDVHRAGQRLARDALVAQRVPRSSLGTGLRRTGVPGDRRCPRRRGRCLLHRAARGRDPTGDDHQAEQGEQRRGQDGELDGRRAPVGRRQTSTVGLPTGAVAMERTPVMVP